jgi:hypothetical protein
LLEKGAAEFTAMAIRARLYQFDLRAMAGGCGQTPVARQQGYVEPNELVTAQAKTNEEEDR